MTTAMFLAVVLAGLVVSAGAQHDPRTVERKLVGNALDIDDGVSHRQLSPLVLRGLAEIVTECKWNYLYLLYYNTLIRVCTLCNSLITIVDASTNHSLLQFRNACENPLKSARI